MCCSPEARARKQARREARRAAFAKLVHNFVGSSSNSKTGALSSYPNTRNPTYGTLEYGTTGDTRAILSAGPTSTIVEGDEKARMMTRAPPSYRQVMGERNFDVKDKAGL